MASYVESNLLPGEDVVHSAPVSFIIYAPFVFLSTALFGAGFLFGEMGKLFWVIGAAALVLGIIVCAIRKASTEIAVTNKRIIIKVGLIRRETVEQFLEKIDSISVEQTVLERLFNAGTIIVRGSGQSFAPVANIDDPLAFRKVVNEQVDKLKTAGAKR